VNKSRPFLFHFTTTVTPDSQEACYLTLAPDLQRHPRDTRHPPRTASYYLILSSFVFSVRDFLQSRLIAVSKGFGWKSLCRSVELGVPFIFSGSSPFPPETSFLSRREGPWSGKGEINGFLGCPLVPLAYDVWAAIELESFLTSPNQYYP